MLAKTDRVSECLVAYVAGEGALAAVGAPDVNLETVRCAEHLPAVQTVVGTVVAVGRRLQELGVADFIDLGREPL